MRNVVFARRVPADAVGSGGRLAFLRAFFPLGRGLMCCKALQHAFTAHKKSVVVIRDDRLGKTAGDAFSRPWPGVQHGFGQKPRELPPASRFENCMKTSSRFFDRSGPRFRQGNLQSRVSPSSDARRPHVHRNFRLPRPHGPVVNPWPEVIFSTQGFSKRRPAGTFCSRKTSFRFVVDAQARIAGETFRPPPTTVANKACFPLAMPYHLAKLRVPA